MQPKPLPDPEIQRPRVLVVDDDDSNRVLMAAYLEAADCEVLLAEDALEVFHWFEKIPPDLILLDVMMPRIDGSRTPFLFSGHGPDSFRRPTVSRN